MKSMLVRNCRECGKKFTTNNNSQIYCGKKCRKEGMKKYRRNFMNNYWKTHSKEYEANQNCHIKLRQKMQLEVFTHYGGNPPKCACCGETEIRFLELDHTNGGGTKHRKSFKYFTGGNLFYAWLIKNRFPEGYQILCANCNAVKGDNSVRFCKIHHSELYGDRKIG